MLEPKEDPAFDAETSDVEFFVYGGDNRLFSVHRDNTLRLWTFPPYGNGCHLYRVFVTEETVRSIHVVKGQRGGARGRGEEGVKGQRVGEGGAVNGQRVGEAGVNGQRVGGVERLVGAKQVEGVKGQMMSEQYGMERGGIEDEGGDDCFLTCEFGERGNSVNRWTVRDGSAVKIKGVSNSYMGAQVRICSVLYLSPHLLAVLISDEGIVHTIDIWNTRSGTCVHRQMYRAYLPVQNIYNIHGFLIIQPWSSMAEIIVWRVTDESYAKTDTGTLLTAPPNNIATYRCVISEDTGTILAGGSTLKIFVLTSSGKLKYLRSLDLSVSGKLLDMVVLQSKVLRLLIVDNAGVSVYNSQNESYARIECEFKHRNKDILVRADSGFTYRPYLFLPDNGLLLVQDTYANRFYWYQLPEDLYVPPPYAEIRKNARLLRQYFDASTLLPAEIWLVILSYGGYLYSKTFARKVASMFFTRPLS